LGKAKASRAIADGDECVEFRAPGGNMEVVLRRSLRLAFLVMAACAFGAMSGCSSGPTAPVIGPAKNVYVIQNSSTNGVEADTVLVIPATATGAVTPVATLQLPGNLVAFAVAAGPDGEIYVGGPVSETVGEVLVYPPGSSGVATPTATLIGGGTKTFTSPLFLTVDSKGKLYVFSSDGSIESFAKGVTSAAAPAQYLTYGVTSPDYFGGMGVDDAGEIFVADELAGIVDVFGAGANGADLPVRSITASSTGSFTDLYGVAVDDAGDVTVMNYNKADDPFDSAGERPVNMARRGVRGHRNRTVRPMDDATVLPTALLTFAAGASGTAMPTRTLSGALTSINEPEGVAVDELLNVYYEDYENGALTVMMFPPLATGNVAASTSITSTVFTSSYFGSIAAH
jgi:hypothetical protein